MYGVAIQLSRYLLLRGYERWKSGWVLLPMGLVLLATMLLGGLLVRRIQCVWALRLGLAGMTVTGFWLSRADLYTSWQWLMATTTLWAFFAGLCLPPIGRLVYEGQPPAQASSTGAMKFFMRAFGGTLGILVAGILLDRAAAWGLDFVRDSVRLGQGALEVTQPEIRDHMTRRGSAPAEAVARTDATIGYWVHLHAQIIGTRTAFRFCAYLSAIALVIACLISSSKEISVLDSDDTSLPGFLRVFAPRAPVHRV